MSTLEEEFPSTLVTTRSPQGALAALMEEWRQEDMTGEAVERQRCKETLLPLQAGLNANRQENGERLVF